MGVHASCGPCASWLFAMHTELHVTCKASSNKDATMSFLWRTYLSS